MEDTTSLLPHSRYFFFLVGPVVLASFWHFFNLSPAELSELVGTSIPSIQSRSPIQCQVGVGKLEGTWINRTIFDDGDPVCCSWDSADLGDMSLKDTRPICSTSTSSKDYSGYISWYGGDDFLMPYSTCDCSKEKLDVIQNYEWAADKEKCQLPNWNAKAFCNSLGQRSLLFIGDSTTAQLSSVVHNYVTWGRGGCASQIFFERSDTLTTVNYGVMNRGLHWATPA